MMNSLPMGGFVFLSTALYPSFSSLSALSSASAFSSWTWKCLGLQKDCDCWSIILIDHRLRSYPFISYYIVLYQQGSTERNARNRSVDAQVLWPRPGSIGISRNTVQGGMHNQCVCNISEQASTTVRLLLLIRQKLRSFRSIVHMSWKRVTACSVCGAY